MGVFDICQKINLLLAYEFDCPACQIDTFIFSICGSDAIALV